MATKVYASLIDNILDEPDISPNFGEEGMGDEKNRGDSFLDLTHSDVDDSFLDDIAGESQHTNMPGGSSMTASRADWNSRAERAVQGGLLAEAAASVQRNTPASFRFSSVKQAAAIGDILGTKIKSASVDKVRANVVAATQRLKRILAKTQEQMAIDGAKTANDYANPSMVPGWAPQVRADIQTIRTGFASYLPHASAKAKKVFASYITPGVTETDTASDDQAISDRELSDSEARNYVHKLLNSGETPKAVAIKIEKMAELQLMNRSIATEYLQSHQGTLGYAYIEPDAYMKSCGETHSRMSSKVGGIRAQSVHRIAACTGCSHFQKAATGGRCNIYKLPIVANSSELLPIINNLTPGAKTAAQKRATLVALANGDNQRASLTPKKADIQRNVRTDHALASTVARTASAKKVATFTQADALAMHKQGSKLDQVYRLALAKVGSARASQVIREFVGSLKKNATSVDLVQIDCSLLKRKLATGNGILGAAKCASCTYRTGMHCGFTGGTLTTFPGMDKVGSNHKIAANAPKDGTKMVREMGLMEKTASPDIDISGPNFDSVDLYGSGINL
jgi:hypothetical protein